MPIDLLGQPITRYGEVLGCERCPLNNVPGIRKIKGLTRVNQQKIFIWAMCPGEEENEHGLELVGRSGELLWSTLKKFGITRTMCAVQNVVRCRPTDAQDNNRDPSKRELQCCSIYNDRALEKNAGSAKVHIILGDVAGLQLLGKHFKKDHPVFWYAPWDAYVVLNWHPSYIVRQGGERAGWDYYTWRDRFRAARSVLDNPGRFGHVKSRKYKLIRTHAEFDEMETALRTESEEGRRISFDIEDGEVDGRRVLLMAGFGTGHYTNPKDWNSWTGSSYCVVLDHPENGYEPTHALEMRARTKRIVEDGSLLKTLHNGSYETQHCKALLGAKVAGYDYDTMYGTYLRYSFMKSFGLDPLTYRFFPEMADYKDSVEEWKGNFAKAPLERLLIRNGGDCDVTQRLEQRFSPHVNYPLVKVYINAGITLDKMEKRGPLLDWKEYEKAFKIVPEMIKKLDRMLQQTSGNPNFNCGSDKEVAWLVYDVLKLTPPEGTEKPRTTNKTVLELMLAETGNSTLELIMKNRALRIIQNTFLKGYARSAKLHDGELRTIWWLTGAVTGRLRSGKGKDKDSAQGVVNFQNLHGNPLLQNLLVSDPNWRKALE